MADPVVAAITAIAPPALAIVGKFILANREPARLKRMKRHSDLLELLPEDASGHLIRLINVEAETYADDQIVRMRRKLDGGTLAALILVGALTAGAIVLGFALSGPLGWWIHLVTGTMALFGLLLMIVGLGQVWKVPEERPAKD